MMEDALGEPYDFDQESSNSPGEEDPSRRKQSRNRAVKSCLPCHRVKKKCDRQRPCNRCIGQGDTGACIYETPDPVTATSSEEVHLRARITELEACLREARARPYSRSIIPAKRRLSTSRSEGRLPANSSSSSLFSDVVAAASVDSSSFGPSEASWPASTFSSSTDLHGQQASGNSQNTPHGAAEVRFPALPAACPPSQRAPMRWTFGPEYLFRVQRSPVVVSERHVGASAAPFIFDRLNRAFAAKHGGQTLVEPNLAFATLDSSATGMSGFTWLGEAADVNLVLNGVAHFLPNPLKAMVYWDGFLTGLDAFFQVLPSDKLSSFWTRSSSAHPSSFANAPHGLALYLAMLSIGSYYSNKPVPTTAEEIDTMRSGMLSSASQLPSEPINMICARFFAFAACSVLRLRSSSGATPELWQAHLAVITVLYNLGEDHKLSFQLSALTRSIAPSRLENESEALVTATSADKDPNMEKIRLRVEAAALDLDFWSSALAGRQPVLSRGLTDPSQLTVLTEQHGVLDSEDPALAPVDTHEILIPMLQCLSYAKEAFEVLHSEDYARVMDLSNRIISWSYKLPNDLAWVPGLIEGSGVNPSTFPPNLGQLPLVYSDPKAMHLLLQVHFRINTTLLMLHRPFSHASQSDITALNASHSIVTVVVMVVQTSRSRGDPTMMLRRRQLWVVLYGALCLMGYQACLYPIEPDMPGIRKDMRNALLCVKEAAQTSMVAQLYLPAFEKLVGYIDGEVLVKVPIRDWTPP